MERSHNFSRQLFWMLEVGSIIDNSTVPFAGGLVFAVAPQLVECWWTTGRTAAALIIWQTLSLFSRRLQGRIGPWSEGHEMARHVNFLSFFLDRLKPVVSEWS